MLELDITNKEFHFILEVPKCDVGTDLVGKCLHIIAINECELKFLNDLLVRIDDN